jgi:hypothetical protein
MEYEAEEVDEAKKIEELWDLTPEVNPDASGGASGSEMDPGKAENQGAWVAEVDGGPSFAAIGQHDPYHETQSATEVVRPRFAPGAPPPPPPGPVMAGIWPTATGWTLNPMCGICRQTVEKALKHGW